jgi:hypothetical protein
MIPLPPGKNLIGCKWVYKTIFTVEGQIEKYKSGLASKGFNRQEGIDYNEKISLVSKMNTIRTILSLAASYKWEIHHMYVKSVLLNGDINEVIYMKQPPGFVTAKKSNLVCKLHKSLYGLKQALRAWYDKIDAYLLKNGFKRCISDPNLYVKDFCDHVLIIVLYLDDLIITGIQLVLIQNMKSDLQKQFEMIDIDILHCFLGLRIWNMANGTFISQPKYATYLLTRFHMNDCSPSPTPFQSDAKLIVECTTSLVDATLYHQLMGSLIYLTHNRPNISFVVILVSRFMQHPHEINW